MLPALVGLRRAPTTHFVLLVKTPSFEEWVGAGVGAGGVVRQSREIVSASVRRVTDAAGRLGLGVLRVTASPAARARGERGMLRVAAAGRAAA